MNETQGGRRRPFGRIANFADAKRIARRAAICGIIFAIMYVIGIVATLWGISAITGGYDPAIAQSMYIVIGLNIVVLVLILFLTWRVSTGRGYISAAVLTLIFVTEITIKFIGGSAANGIIIVYAVMAVLLVDGVRASFIGARMAKRPINPADVAVFD